MNDNERAGAAVLVAAVATSALAVADAVWRDVGSTPVWDADAGRPWAIAAASAVHASAYALLALGLRPLLGAAGTATRWSARALVAALAALTVGFTLATAAAGFPPVVEVLAGPGFALMFLSAVVLGLALLRRGERLAPGLLLAAPLAVVPVLTALSLTSWDGAHPAYAEVPVYLGAALLAAAPARRVTPHALHPLH